MNLYGSSSPELWILKVMCLLAVFIVAFFAFAMAIRLANHVVFMVNVPRPVESPGALAGGRGRPAERCGPQFQDRVRAFFFAVPLVFWLFGPLFLVVATVGLVFALHRIDRTAAV